MKIEFEIPKREIDTHMTRLWMKSVEHITKEKIEYVVIHQLKNFLSENESYFNDIYKECLTKAFDRYNESKLLMIDEFINKDKMSK